MKLLQMKPKTNGAGDSVGLVALVVDLRRKEAVRIVDMPASGVGTRDTIKALLAEIEAHNVGLAAAVE
jgi:hypothetical protein